MAMGGDINALSTFPIEWWLGRRTEDQGQGFPAGGHYPSRAPGADRLDAGRHWPLGRLG